MASNDGDRDNHLLNHTVESDYTSAADGGRVRYGPNLDEVLCNTRIDSTMESVMPVYRYYSKLYSCRSSLRNLREHHGFSVC
jgi:hypothetical protein